MTDLNQRNKHLVRDFWQALDAAASGDVEAVAAAVMASDVTWHGPAPLGDLKGVGSFASQYWAPLKRALPPKTTVFAACLLAHPCRLDCGLIHISCVHGGTSRDLSASKQVRLVAGAFGNGLLSDWPLAGLAPLAMCRGEFRMASDLARFPGTRRVVFMVTAGRRAAACKAGKTANKQSNAVQKRPLHRIRSVRLQQGVSMRTAARHTGTDVRQLRMQEDESADLRLSELHKWQDALDVPISELLVEPDSSLSPPVLGRSQMLRLMKTLKAIQQRAQTADIQRMASTACEQLAEIMPELSEVSPWHEYGQRRSLDEDGRIAERPLSDDLLHPHLTSE